jgi:HAD superfamily hydrolase (TIGR01490 family)
MTGPSPRIVFADVDETLITVKSMMRFLRHHLDRTDGGRHEYDRIEGTLNRLAESGTPRTELNRLYYRAFVGQPVETVMRHGREWFDRELVGGRLFHEPVLAACRAYRERGVRIALVSGSFDPCLAPIAEHVAASWTLCGGPVAADGIYTDELLPTVIGPGKAVAVRRLLSATGVDAAECVAFGDHASDLPMLLAVGSAVVVGDDPVLVEQGTRRGWQRLPGVLSRPQSDTPLTTAAVAALEEHR